MKSVLLSSAALLLAAGGAALPSSAALAEGELADTVILNMRLRYETVDQDGLAEDASALTLRTRFGFETPRHQGFALLVEGENTLHIVDDFADTITPRPGYPVVADPEVTELNRLQLSWQGESGNGATLGRQWIALDDQRFVGPVGFRQNSQSFDAVRLTSGSLWPVSLDYAYIDRVHRIFGDDHPMGEFDSASHVGEARMDTPLGQVAGYALLLDFDNAPGLSSQTYGLRLTGRSDAVTYRFEYARQSDYAGNSGDFDVDYMRAEMGYEAGRYSLGGGVEVLGGDGMAAFQTPLATLHKFQGAADVFLTTPAEGLRDLYLRGAWRFPDAAPGPLTLSATAHDFASDDGDIDYGSELDLVAALGLGERWSVEAKAAMFDGDAPGFADRNKVWLTLVFDY